MDFRFIVVLAKLASEGVQRHIGCSFPSRVFGDHGGVEVNSFFLPVLLDVVSFLLLRLAPGGATATFLFNFQPSVDVRSKESTLSFFKMPYLVYAFQLIPISMALWISGVHHVLVSIRSSSVWGQT